MSGDPVLLVASHPTRGVDVGAQAAIWDHIRDARRLGLAVLLISADLDELIGLSDSIKVILRGRFVGDFDPQHVTPAGARLRDDRGRCERRRRTADAASAIAIGLAAPVLAIVMAMLITIGILVLSGNSVSGFLTTIFSVPAPRNVVNIINNSSVLYLSALAAAIGFRMNLFNIGVEGQYRVARLRGRRVRRPGLAARRRSTSSWRS